VKIHVNSVELFYNVSGQGEPIILLHGNGQDHTVFKSITKKLSADFTVYGIDSRDHGQSSRVKFLDYHSKMEDVAAFIEQLGLDKPIVYGFSDGGIIGLLLAIYYPDRLSKLIISGANTYPDGIKRSSLLLVKTVFFFTRSKKLKLMLTQPNITNAQLNTITVPTLVLAGKRDLIKEEHTRNIAANIPNCELRILSGESHTSYVFDSDSEKLYDIIKVFIGG